MVTAEQKAQLLDAFERSFHHIQLMRVWVDEHTHAVNVKAHSIGLKVKHKIPIRMGLVMANFHCSRCDLLTLEHAPHTVTGNFECYGNALTSLQGGPQSVGSAMLGGGTYSCSYNQLSNFEGAPQDFSGYFVGVHQPHLQSVVGLPPDARLVDITHAPDLPLLKLLQQKQVNMRSPHDDNLMQDLTHILDKYAGQGKTAMLNCALELKKNGYAGNAKW